MKLDTQEPIKVCVPLLQIYRKLKHFWRDCNSADLTISFVDKLGLYKGDVAILIKVKECFKFVKVIPY